MIKSWGIDSFFKRNACNEDEKNASMLSKLEKLHYNPKIEENEKQLSKVPKITYNEFWKWFRTWSGETSSNLVIPTKSNWWGTKDWSKIGSVSNIYRKLFIV